MSKIKVYPNILMRTEFKGVRFSDRNVIKQDYEKTVERPESKSSKCHDNCVGKQQVVKMLKQAKEEGYLEGMKHSIDELNDVHNKNMIGLLDEAASDLEDEAFFIDSEEHITLSDMYEAINQLKQRLTNNLTEGDENG